MSDPTRGGDVVDQIRIRRNVETMRAKGATPDEIEHYLRDIEGMQPQGPSGRPAQDGSFTKSLPSGSGDFGDGGSALDPLLHGATFEFSDEAGGVLSALTNPASYRSAGDFAANYRGARDLMRERASSYRKGHPKASAALELAGGAVTAIPTLGGGALAARGAGMGARMLAGAKAGAIAGGISGVGAGEGDVGSQLLSGAAGAALGGATGGLLQPVTAAAGAAGRGVRNVVEAIRPANGDVRAAVQLAAALEKAGVPRDQLATHVRTLAAGGDDADLLLNTMPETVKRLARAVRARPGRGSEILNERLHAQAVGDATIPSSNERVASLTERTLGQSGPVNAVEKQAALLEKAQQDAAPHYDVFRGRGELPMQEGDDLATLLANSGEIQREIAAVKRLSAYKGLPDHDARVLDAVYKRLGARVELEQNGAVKHDLWQELAALRAAMEARGPEYADALGEYSAGARVRDAFVKGQRMPQSAPDVVDATARAFAAPLEADALRAGAAANVRQRAETSKLGGDIVGKLFGTPAAARRMGALQPDAARRAAFEQGIEREARRIADRRLIQGNSQTADKLLEEQDFQTPALTVLQQLAQGRPGRALVTAAGSAYQPLVEGRNRATREALARILTASPTRDPQAVAHFLDLLTRAAEKRARAGGFSLLAAPLAGEDVGERVGRP